MTIAPAWFFTYVMCAEGLFGRRKLRSFTKHGRFIVSPARRPEGSGLLIPDERGALHLSVRIGNVPGAEAEQEAWRLSAVGLEVRGRMGGGT